MKYKIKQELQGQYGRVFTKDQVIDSNVSTDFKDAEGIVVLIPFSDTRFFEPVKTRKFVVEMEEKYVENFDFLLGTGTYSHDDRWTVTEITEQTLPYWVIEFKSQHPEAKIDSFEGIDPEWIVENFKGRKADARDWLRIHCDCGIVSAQRLMDYLFNNFN